MGEGLGVRAENTAKLEAFPSPRRGEGMIASTRCLSEQHYVHQAAFFMRGIQPRGA